MTNKEIALKMYEVVFNGHQAERAGEFMQENYIQHNPGVPTGLHSFISFFKEHFKKHPGFKVEIKHVIAEGDYVVLHTHAKSRPEERGGAVVDIYRFENGKAAEHWDVIQQIPENFIHGNGMF